MSCQSCFAGGETALNDYDSPDGFASTGARAIRDHFGRLQTQDEECGDSEIPDFADFFGNAMFRAGQISGASPQRLN